MADPQTSSPTPADSLPTSLISPPEDMSYFAQPKSLLTLPPTQTASLLPQQPAPAPAPAPQPAPAQPVVQPQPSLAPTPAPTVGAPTPVAAPPAAPPPSQPGAAAAPAATPTYTAVGDSIAAGIAGSQHFHQTYDVNDNPASRANPGMMAASGRTTAQTLSVISANPQQFAGQNVILSTGMSNDLNGGIPLDTAMTNVASQLDALRKAGANVTLLGVGAGVKDAAAANAKLAQIAQAYNIPFTGELADTQASADRPASVHPRNNNYGAIFGQIHPQQPSTPGTGKTIDDATAFIQTKEGGGPFVLYGHEGQSYDPNAMPTKPGYYGFPDWAGGRGPDGRETHAAGGAQWEPDTWKKAVEGFSQEGLANQLGHTPDFRNPADQKAVFNYWAARRYREETGRDLVADLNAGHVDWSSLGSEWSSLKGAGTGGIQGMTVSNLPGYQDWRRVVEGERQTLQDESADLQKRMADLEAGSPEQRALADQLLKKQISLMDKYETLVDHPPTQKPHDAIANFGSLATLIGILGGRFAHRPMVASLNAAGAAMQAMNDNDYDAYKNAFNTWKTQTDMTSKLIGMESDTYKNIMEDRRLTMDEKFKEMDAASKIYQNRLLSQQLEAGEYEKAWEYAQKLEQTHQEAARSQAEIEHYHAETEKLRAEAQQQSVWGELAGTDDTKTAARAYIEAKHAQLEKDAQAKGQPAPPSLEEMAKDPALRKEALDAVRAKGQQNEIQTATDEVLKIRADQRGVPVEQLRADPKEVQSAREEAIRNIAQARSGQPALTEDALNRLAEQYILGRTSVLTSLPRGGPARIELENKIAEILKSDPDAAQRLMRNELAMDAAKSAARAAGRITMQTDLYSTEAQRAGDEVVRTSKLFPRGNYPTVNAALRAYESQTGDPNVIRFGAALNALMNTYGKMSNPTGQGIHDADKARLATILDTSLSEGQIEAGVDQIQREGRIIASAARDAQKEVLDEMMPGGRAPASTTTTTTPAPPKPGDVVDGHRFKGGDPADQNNWEAVQ